jgi:hypothetical protein
VAAVQVVAPALGKADYHNPVFLGGVRGWLCGGEVDGVSWNHNVSGVTPRVAIAKTDYIPGADSNEYLVAHWEGAEMAIMPFVPELSYDQSADASPPSFISEPELSDARG